MLYQLSYPAAASINKKKTHLSLLGVEDSDLVDEVDAVAGVDVQLDETVRCQFVNLVA